MTCHRNAVVWSENEKKIKILILNEDDISRYSFLLSCYPGFATGPTVPPDGLGPWNPNLGGGVLSFLPSRDLFLTTLE